MSIREKSIILLRLLGLILFIGAIFWIAVMDRTHDVWTMAKARHEFEAEFGFPPPPSVTEIYINDYDQKDTGRRFMRFTCDTATFKRILSKGFLPSKDWFFAGSGWTNPPLWWDPSHSRQMDVGKASSWHSRFPVTDAIVARDPQTGQVYFFWNGRRHATED